MNSNHNLNHKNKRKVVVVSGFSLSIGFILILLAFILNFVYVSIVTTTNNTNSNNNNNDNLGGYYLDVIEDSSTNDNNIRKWKNNKKTFSNNNNLESGSGSTSMASPSSREENDKENMIEKWRLESSVFNHILKRALTNLEISATSECKNPTTKVNNNEKNSLQEYGIINAISQGLLLSDNSNTNNNSKCYLPLDESCNDNGITVVLLNTQNYNNHNNNNIEKKLSSTIKILSNNKEYPLIKEIIFLWNSYFHFNSTSTFTSTFKNNNIIKIIQKWNEDKIHPLRVIYNTTITSLSFPNEYNPNILNVTNNNALLYININNNSIISNKTITHLLSCKSNDNKLYKSCTNIIINSIYLLYKSTKIAPCVIIQKKKIR